MARTILITGASAGIGAATARLLVRRGFRVFGTSRRPETVSDRIEGVTWLAMDVTDEESVRAGVGRVGSEVGAIDALACCAGYGIFGSVEETSLSRVRAQFETNVIGTLAAIRAVLPGMRSRGSGRIVVVGSLAGRAPIPFQAHYSATKAAVDALVMALRNEVGPYGVSAVLVEPGDINTEFNDRMDWGDWRTSAYGARIERCAQVILDSLPRAPGPEKVARIILRALTAAAPRPRYAVGPASWLVPFARRVFPDRWLLAAIRGHFRL